jgi:hypothetical protein
VEVRGRARGTCLEMPRYSPEKDGLRLGGLTRFSK